MSALFFDHKRLLALAVLLVLTGGLTSMVTLTQKEDPTITNRFATILTPVPGASADRVEQLVTEPIEDELREISEIDEIFSASRTGLSVVTIALDDLIDDTDGPFSLVRDALSDAERRFPEDAREPVFDNDRTYAYTLIAALVWEADSEPNLLILRRIARELQSRLRNTPGTELVTLHGAPADEVVVSMDPAVSESLGLDKPRIAAALAGADSKVSAGQFRGERNEYVVEVRGELDSLSRVRETPVSLGESGSLVRVGDIARVERALVDPPDRLALVDGKPAVLVAARMESDLRVGDWARGARAAVEEFRGEVSSGVRLDVVFDQSAYAGERFGSLIRNLLIGAGIVVLVLFATLGWRSALIVASAIPLTGLSALLVMKLVGVPIHQMSITGLIVALGLLVDAAIVMTDAIGRRLRDGLTAREAVAVSVERLWLPLLSSTLTTVLAFAPIALLPGSVGEFVGAIGESVIIALIASFLLAVTVLAALAGLFLPRGMAQGGLSLPWLSAGFERLLRLSLKAPRISMLAAATPCLIGFYAVTLLPSQFFPEADRNQFEIELRLSPQAAIGETLAAARRANALLEARAEIVSAEWVIGESFPSFYYNLQMSQDGVSSYAQAMVTARSLDGLKPLIQDIQAELDAALPGVQVLASPLMQGPPIAAPIEMRIFGPELDTLRELGESVRLTLSEIPEVTVTNAGIAGGRPKLWLRPEEDGARQAGLTLVDIARGLDAELTGVFGGSLVEGGESLPIRVRLADEERAQFDELASINIPTRGPGGDTGFAGAPIGALGAFSLQPDADAITRFDAERVNIVTGYVRPGELPSTALAAFERRWDGADADWPLGYRLELGGDAEARSDAVGDLVAQVGLISVLMIATVVLTFNSFRISLIVFAVIGLAMGLGMLSLAIAGYPFGFQPIIGLIGLAGVAVNAAIIILSGLKRSPEARRGDPDAIVGAVTETGRHIVSTTVTTFGGFLPLILSVGGFWPPFATVIAGGVLLSMIVSFFFVPQAFAALYARPAYSQ